jgi:hypothetical protein
MDEGRKRRVGGHCRQVKETKRKTGRIETRKNIEIKQD